MRSGSERRKVQHDVIARNSALEQRRAVLEYTYDVACHITYHSPCAVTVGQTFHTQHCMTEGHMFRQQETAIFRVQVSEI
jgi:hypothetical protein